MNFDWKSALLACLASSLAVLISAALAMQFGVKIGVVPGPSTDLVPGAVYSSGELVSLEDVDRQVREIPVSSLRRSVLEAGWPWLLILAVASFFALAGRDLTSTGVGVLPAAAFLVLSGAWWSAAALAIGAMVGIVSRRVIWPRRPESR